MMATLRDISRRRPGHSNDPKRDAQTTCETTLFLPSAIELFGSVLDKRAAVSLVESLSLNDPDVHADGSLSNPLRPLSPLSSIDAISSFLL
jgi:hypothetical protein